MTGDQRRDHRRSIWLKGYDYTRDGAYFVTLCTQDRARVFGAVVDGEMRSNEYGWEIAGCWLWLAEQYPYVALDEWVVMPNHLHGIIVITDDGSDGANADGTDVGGRWGGSGRGGSRTAPTKPRDMSTGPRDMPTGFTGQPIAPGTDGIRTTASKRKPLGRLIGAFKTVSTRRVNDIRSTPGAKLWQRNYYEHVVRDDPSLRRIRKYIASNPSRWALDRER